MEPILKLEHIQKYYGNGGNVTKAIQDISFSVSEGEFLGIMGASGSGKTTLLNCISTIDTVSAGHIYLEGTDVTELRPKSLARFRRENLGFVFQDFNLLDTLTISENIALALAINGAPAGEVEPRIREMAEKLNIRDILDKYPYQVSGGQKQRCACARAIINHPKLLLADEPTGALDSHSAQMLLSTIQSINEQLGATILITSGCMPLKKTLAEMDWNTLVILAAAQGFAKGLDVSGGGKVIADAVLNLFGGQEASTAVLMAVGVIVTTILTNFMSNTALAAMMTPLYIQIANSLGVSPVPFVIAIGCVATNLACATPVGTPACTQTLPAGYKYMDYMKIGGPLAIILMIAAAALAPVMYPF